jgi:hypothetical protein
MSNERRSSALISALPVLGGGVLAAGLIAFLTIALPSHEAQATPAYAAQTKLPCGKCHVNPAGGGPNTDFGKAFAAKGHKL